MISGEQLFEVRTEIGEDLGFRSNQRCPLKPGIKCKISAHLSSPCICPKIQSFLDHADRYDQRRDALGTSPGQTTTEDRPHGIPIPTWGARSSDLPLPMREPAFEPTDLQKEGYF